MTAHALNFLLPPSTKASIPAAAQAGMLASPLADGIALMRQRKFQSARDVLSPALIDAPSREAAALGYCLLGEAEVALHDD